MCVQDSDHPADQDLLKSSNLYHTQPPINSNNGNSNDNSNHNNGISNEGPPDFQSQIDFLNAQMQNSSSPNSNSLPLESISEDTAVALDEERNASPDFLPILRSGEWADIGGRDYMEDTHVCIADLAKKFGCGTGGDEAISFYGVANAGDCRAVLSRRGVALVMSKDHRPCCKNERTRIESLGGFVEYGYLNGQLAVTRALGDWHLEGMKQSSNMGGGPLSAEPELELITLTREDEFLIIASDGIWEFFSNQNAVDFARRRLQVHNDVKLCCKEIIEEAMKRGATDNLTVVMVCFHLDSPPPIAAPQKMRVRRSISAEGLQNLKLLLQG
ncbi:hypothetical protein Cgig2_016862 [Carnegiea gigantea]|uniref:PPM-type phosphatase domain-containing protein n=1 Tax=Carnegiea gigantea TaxID=171969 RepID=A0A9Q1K5B1_9CARY|nr:hypothetical protein Cgig2_016862 [Carnegiea gigantea]